MRQLAVFTHILPYGTRVPRRMAGPRASDGEGRNLVQGADLLNIAGEKTVGSGTLGYPKHMTAERHQPSAVFF